MNDQEKADFIVREMARVALEATDDTFKCVIYAIVLHPKGQSVMCSNPSPEANAAAAEAITSDGGLFSEEIDVLAPRGGQSS